MNSTSLGEQRPRLLDCRIDSSGSRLIIENQVRGGEILFPLDRKNLIERLDGQRTVKEVMAGLHAEGSRLGFRALIMTLQTLKEHGLLDGFELSGSGEVSEEEAFFDLERVWLFRPFLTRRLVARAEIKELNAIVFFLFAMMIAAVAIFAPNGILRLPEKFVFLKLQGGYLWALPLLYLAISAMRTMKTLLKCMVALLATGRFYSLELKVSWYGSFLDVSDHGIFHSLRMPVVVVYQLISALSYFFIAAVICMIFPSAGLRSTLAALAVLMTLADLHPYHRSDLTRLLALFWGERQLLNMIPYLKSRSLFAMFVKPGRIANETTYLIYSALALLWVSFAMVFSLKILRDNLPVIVASGFNGPFMDYFSRSALAIGLMMLFIYSLSDIFTTLAKNLIEPIFAPLARLRQKLRSREASAAGRADLRELLARVPGFDGVSEQALTYLLEHSAIRTFSSKTNLVIQGAAANELFVLVKGEVEVVKREDTGLETRVATLHAPTVFGEIGVIRNVKRTASVMSRGESEVIVINKDVFDWMLNQTGLESDQKLLLSKFSLSHYIASSPLFAQLPAEALQIFARRGSFEAVSAGTAILREGEVSKSFYLLLEGRVDVSKDGSPVAELKQGDFFGEIALIADMPRTATVTAVKESLVLRLDQNDFWDILSNHLHIAMMIESIAETRIEEVKCSA